MKLITALCFTLITFFRLSADVSSDRINHLLIFPFYPVQSSFPPEYQFLSTTIPDLIKQEVISHHSFYLIEKPEIEKKAPEITADPEYFTDEKKRYEIARLTDADYICFGYFYYGEEKITVTWQIADADTRRTVKIENVQYEISESIYSLIEESTRKIAIWINQELPRKSLKTVFIRQNEEITDPLLLKKLFYFDYLFKRYFEINTALLYSFYMEPFRTYITDNLGASLSLRFYIPKASYLHAGVNTSLFILYGKSSESKPASDVILFHIPIVFYFGANFHLFKYLEIDGSLGAGFAVFAGYIINQTGQYVRPTFSADSNILFTPVKYFKIGGGLSVHLTPNGYQDWLLVEIAPRITLGASF